jgi:hypothetical protein
MFEPKLEWAEQLACRLNSPIVVEACRFP